MVTVAVVAVILSLEPFLFQYAVDEVRSGDTHYIWDEAVTVWIILNVAITIAIGAIVTFFHAALQDRRVRCADHLRPGLEHGPHSGPYRSRT